MKFHENRTLAKISEFTVLYGQNYRPASWPDFLLLDIMIIILKSWLLVNFLFLKLFLKWISQPVTPGGHILNP